MGIKACVNMASCRLDVPLMRGKSYSLYKKQLDGWETITKTAKKDRAMTVALSLPEEGYNNIKAKVFNELKPEELQAENGLKSLTDFMDKYLEKNELDDMWEKFIDFEECKRDPLKPMSQFVSDFDDKYKLIESKGIIIPAAILSFKLVKNANIKESDRKLVMTGVDFTKKDDMFEDAKTALNKFLGGVVSDNSADSDKTSSEGASKPIKVEPAWLAENENVLATHGYYRGSGRGGYGGYGGARGGRGGARGRGYGNYYSDRPSGYKGNPGGKNGNKSERPVNPKSADGSYLTCHSCGSFRHLLSECPYSWENMKTPSHVMMSEEERICLFTGYNQRDIGLLGSESKRQAILDSACTSSCMGSSWYECFKDGLAEGESIKETEGVKMFKFGGGERLKSLKCVQLPCMLAGRDVMIEADVVDSDIPLLLSLKAMKGAQVKLDLENDEAEIFGKKVSLNYTTSGHYCIPVDRAVETKVEEICKVELEGLDKQQRRKVIEKLHRQFVHPAKERLIALLKDAGIWNKEYEEDLDHIHEKCKTCLLYKKTPARPVVSLPMASHFNEKVAMDLKLWKGGYILHMIDMFTRLSVSVFVKSKRPQDILDKMLRNWIAVWGLMGSVLFDNGGEFSNEEMREAASILGIEVCTTPAQSPWSNGLCERNHQVTDRMLEMLVEDNPETSLDVLLAWANMAKNSLQMYSGYSSFQLVIGHNPNLPNIMTGKLPSMEGKTCSEVVAQHINALHEARRAFVKCEADERVRRALRHQVRAVEERFEPGDRVMYKREGNNRWMGPGKVIFQDGRVVFVRHGGVYVRVSTNRLVKDGSEFQEGVDGLEEQESDVKVNNKVGEIDIDDGANVDNGIHEHIIQDEVKDIRDSAEVHHALKKNEIIKYQADMNGDWKRATVVGRAGKATGKYRYHYNVRDTMSGEMQELNLEGLNAWSRCGEGDDMEEVNVVMIPRQRQSDKECMDAKQVELEKLKNFGVYEEVEDNGQSCISTTWVLWKKGEEIRARLVARGYEETTDIDKDSPTVVKSTMRILLAIAAYRKWPVKTTDIKSAFLQGKDIERDVYVVPPKEAQSGPWKVWKLRKSLYGLNDAARQFYNCVEEELKKLGVIRSNIDPALFMYMKNGEVVGILATHVDDFIHCGEVVFEEVMEKLRNRLIAGKVEEGVFSYVGFDIKQEKDGIVLDQSRYMKELSTEEIKPQRAREKLDSLTKDEHKKFRSLVGKCNWASRGCRPDVAFDVIDLSTRFHNPVVGDLVRANKLITKLKEEASYVFYPRIDAKADWKLVVLSDASFGNLGVSSCGGHIIVLMGEDNKCCVLGWSSGKIKRVVKSTLAAEMLSMCEGLDHAIYLKHVVKELIPKTKEIQIVAVVDSKSVVDAVFSTKSVDEKRLRIDVGSVKEMIANGDIQDVRWVPGCDMVADVLTKKGVASYQILQLLQLGKLNV